MRLFLFVGARGECNNFGAHRPSELHGKVSESSNSDDSDTAAWANETNQRRVN
jgi:hypothetical protein